jgi:putative FmdB family regulatory protein
MPTYEYKCCKCGHQFEKFQSITAAPIKTCPTCRGRVKKLLSTGGGIIFKGGGFYETDYKKKMPPAKSTSGGDAGKSGAESAKPVSGTSHSSSGKAENK